MSEIDCRKCPMNDRCPGFDGCPYLLSLDLARALKGLRYVDKAGVEPDGFCDHAAEPCPRCERARAALLRYSQAREDKTP